MQKQSKKVLISVYCKEGLNEVIKTLNKHSWDIVSTGGTEQYINELGYNVTSVESITGYPSILGGRVKTLHPSILGGILARSENEQDNNDIAKYNISPIKIVIVDLYPFEDTVKSGASHEDIIEKIDIGGITLLRAAAKNYNDTLVISHKKQYNALIDILNKGEITLEDRKEFAKQAFMTTSHYDTLIWNYFGGDFTEKLKISVTEKKRLRYGENPHQCGIFYGNIEDMFDIFGEKEISYNNILDIDAAINLIDDFDTTTVAILKHNNACGLAARDKLIDAWRDALAGDPVSAFGGIVITNGTIDFETAQEIDKLFYEVLIAPDFDKQAFDLLTKKSKRILLRRKHAMLPNFQVRSALNGILVQDKDKHTSRSEEWKNVTDKHPIDSEIQDLKIANIVVKHTKSNTIVLVKNKQLIGSGTGQTSRIDALRQAIVKTKAFGFELKGAVMASDAFFPFSDCVELAHSEGITSVIQPGGSIRDKDTIEYCNKNNISMIITGIRHFKH